MFAIGFSHDDAKFGMRASKHKAMALITIGDFWEHFLVPFTYWSREKYINQWNEGILRIVSGKHPHSALMASLTDPRRSHHLVWWLLYRIGDSVVIQNQMLILDQLQSPFDEVDPYTHIPRHRAANEDGIQISEWRIPVLGFRQYRITE